MLSPERQSASMSKITNDCLTKSGTGCFIAVPIWQQLGVKGLKSYLKCSTCSGCLSMSVVQ